MYTIFAILIIITSILLVLVVLVQNPKGGGLSSSFGGGGGGNQIMGAKKTTDFLEKATWTLAIILISLSLLSNFTIPRANTEQNVEIKAQEQIDNAVIPNLPEDSPIRE